MKNNDLNIVEYVSGTRKYRVTLVPGRRGRVLVEYFRSGQFVEMKPFEVGTSAEYDSFNPSGGWGSYTGPIVSIGKKTVTLKTSDGGNKRLKAEEFGWRNVGHAGP